MVSDATAKVGDTVSDLAAKTEKVVQEKIDQGKPVLRDLQASAGAAIDKAAGLARDASSAGVQAVAQASDAIQGVAREVGNKVDQAATTAYQEGARAGGYVIHARTTADRPAHCWCYRVWPRLSDTPELKIYASLRSRSSLKRGRGRSPRRPELWPPAAVESVLARTAAVRAGRERPVATASLLGNVAVLSG
jgi:hypothetical protein